MLPLLNKIFVDDLLSPQCSLHASFFKDDIYSGILKFHYSDGLGNYTENLEVQASSTVSELLPELITRFLPHQYQLDAVDGTQPSSIALVQGQSEYIAGVS